MRLYHDKVPAILEKMVINARDKGSPAEAIKLAMHLKECTSLSSENAAKLAPYRHPKLESVDIRSEVEHRFVLRSPEPVKSIDDWAKATGASILDVTKQLEKFEPPKPKPYISELAEMESDEDEANYYNGKSPN